VTWSLALILVAMPSLLGFGIGGLWAEIGNRRTVRAYRAACEAEDRRLDAEDAARGGRPRPRFPHNVMRWG
jgi:hypothetical protein